MCHVSCLDSNIEVVLNHLSKPKTTLLWHCNNCINVYVYSHNRIQLNNEKSNRYTLKLCVLEKVNLCFSEYFNFILFEGMYNKMSLMMCTIDLR
mmetsp:Transcript_28110/g.34720  ORF Transcript_28110/g.34720 Transcript_28110/m.34720 type:complete len:94 (-) Transcript_28110:137-418(-)